MSETRSRFVLLCQQTLACALVVAFAAPAANTVTLDIVAPTRTASQRPVLPAAHPAAPVSHHVLAPTAP
jgi:hypothetical protein